MGRDWEWGEGVAGVPEVLTESTLGLQRLYEHLVLAHVVVRDGATCELHGLLEVSARNLGSSSASILFPSRVIRISASIASRMAILHECWHTSVRSAPEKPFVICISVCRCIWVYMGGRTS